MSNRPGVWPADRLPGVPGDLSALKGLHAPVISAVKGLKSHRPTP